MTPRTWMPASFETSASIGIRPGAETAGGLDWGFQGMTAWDVGMAHKDNVKVQLEMPDLHARCAPASIIEDIVGDVLKYRIRTSMRTARTHSRTPIFAPPFQRHRRAARSMSNSAAPLSRCHSAGRSRSLSKDTDGKKDEEQEAGHREGRDARKLPRLLLAPARCASQRLSGSPSGSTSDIATRRTATSR